jgi:hypothetical protein
MAKIVSFKKYANLYFIVRESTFVCFLVIISQTAFLSGMESSLSRDLVIGLLNELWNWVVTFSG